MKKFLKNLFQKDEQKSESISIYNNEIPEKIFLIDYNFKGSSNIKSNIDVPKIYMRRFITDIFKRQETLRAHDYLNDDFVKILNKIDWNVYENELGFLKLATKLHFLQLYNQNFQVFYENMIIEKMIKIELKDNSIFQNTNFYQFLFIKN